MSTKEKMLGKESNNKKAHRHYSLLLLALLFIGFATYGTYAYFTSSTTTNKGHLTLNGTTGSYTLGTGSSSVAGDGLATKGENQYTGAETDGSGNVTTSGNFGGNAATDDYSKKIAEFDWVYTGNKNDTVDTLDASKPTALPSFNSAIVATATAHGRQFNNVTGGDVFRKTVRLAVSSSKSGDTTPAKLVIEWDGTGTYSLDNLSTKKIFVKKGSVTTGGLVDTTKPISDVTLSSQDLTPGMKIEGEGITIKPGEYVEIDLLVQVSNKSSINGTELAELARQITVTVSQNTAIKPMSNTPAAGAQAN